MFKKNIGLVLSLNRFGGGTYQWTINILHALEDYRKTNNTVSINIFYSRQCEDYQRIQREFPGFQYHLVNGFENFLCKVLARVICLAPWLTGILRFFYPLNGIGHRKRIDLMIFPGANFHTCFYNRKQMFMFTDIAHVFYPRFPEMSGHGELRRRHVVFTYGIRQADMVVVDSGQLRRDIVKYYNADVNKVEVLYQTISQTVVDEEACDEESAEFIRQLPGKYLFYPAQLWAHKNHKNLFLAMKFLVEKDRDLVLVLSGSRQEGDDKIFSLIKEFGIEDNVRYLGYVTDKSMRLLYKNARMLVMPTYFGPTNIPTLEAFHFGCPAVISDLPGVREQVKDAALFFDPDSPEDIAQNVRRVLEDNDLRAGMVRKGHERMVELSFGNYRDRFSSILDKAMALGTYRKGA